MSNLPLFTKKPAASHTRDFVADHTGSPVIINIGSSPSRQRSPVIIHIGRSPSRQLLRKGPNLMRHSVEEIELKNGAKGLLIDVPDASVMSTRIHFRGGMSYAKSPEVYEIAHVVEHLSFGANAKYRSEEAFDAEFSKNGAYHNAWTSDFSVCYETECADFEWDRILDLQRISITSPRFNTEELTSEKGNVRTELTSYLNEYPRLIWPRLQRAIGENVPDLRERLKTLPNIELKDIREHYRRTHTAANMRFIIAGKMHRRRRQIIKMLEDWELKPGKLLPLPRYDLHAATPVNIRRKDAANINFGFSWVTPRAITPAEAAAMHCLSHILCGTMSSRIFGQARKLGLVYYIDSSFSNSPYETSWDFDGKVNAENAEPLFDLIRLQMTKLLNGELTDAEIAAAKSYSLGRHQISAQTVGQIADQCALDYFLLGDILTPDRMPTLIEAVDKDAIVRLAREFVDSGIHALVAVSSEEKALINSLDEKLKL